MQENNGLIKHFDGKLELKTLTGSFFVYGDLPSDFGNLNITLVFEEIYTKKKYRSKVDLFDRIQTQKFIEVINKHEDIDSFELEIMLTDLTNQLEEYREIDFQKNRFINKRKSQYHLPPLKEDLAMDLLKDKSLMNIIGKLIEECGIVGEENTRLLLFVVATSYKSLDPLHIIVNGSSGSGKSHLINTISSLMPSEDVINLTRVSNRSFYNFDQEELQDKILIIQDYDGMDDDAQFAFREMQTAKFLNYSVSVKNKFGNYVSKIKEVKTHFSSLAATTQNLIYHDNLSRSLLVGVDESESQTLKIINFQNLTIKDASIIQSQANKVELIQNCIRLLVKYQVVNPFADKIILPIKFKSLRRLNKHFQACISQITLLHQFQRKRDENNNLITTIEDIELANSIFFEVLVWKLDELDNQIRNFYEMLKTYLAEINKTFTTREIRLEFNMSKTQLFRYLEELKSLEYITIVGGSVNRGFIYKINHWDDIKKIKKELRSTIQAQIETLKEL